MFSRINSICVRTFDVLIQLNVVYTLLTTQREVHSGRSKYDAVLLVDSYFTVSSQIIETTLKMIE